MSVYKETKNNKQKYRVDFLWTHKDGTKERIREWSPVQTLRGAEAHERTLRQQLQEGGVRQDAECPTLKEWAPDWIEKYCKADRQKHSTIVAKESILRTHLIPLFGAKPLNRITGLDVRTLKAKLKDAKAKTLNNVLTVLSSLLKAGAEPYRYLPPKAELVAVDEPEMCFYEEAEYERIVKVAEMCGKMELLLVLLGGEAGLRGGEIMALEWTDFRIDGRAGKVTIARSQYMEVTDSTKGRRPRTIPLTERLVAALQGYRHLQGPRVFYRGDTPQRLAFVTLKILKTAMKRVERRANIKDLGQLHILRHTFCSRLAIRGVPPTAIMELAGHKNLKTTMRYMHLAPSAKDLAIKSLEGGYAPLLPSLLGSNRERLS